MGYDAIQIKKSGPVSSDAQIVSSPHSQCCFSFARVVSAGSIQRLRKDSADSGFMKEIVAFSNSRHNPNIGRPADPTSTMRRLDGSRCRRWRGDSQRLVLDH
jgi:hypothetical protein